MQIDDIKALIEMLKETDVTDLQVEIGEMKVQIRRERASMPFEMPRYMPQIEPVRGTATPAMALPESPRASAADEGQDSGRLVTVTAPLVGTFYRSASPDSSSFVEVGDRVKKGQVICIVEAMKLMNEIECEVDGTIVKCLVDNSQPVEYGEPLFLIEPA